MSSTNQNNNFIHQQFANSPIRNSSSSSTSSSSTSNAKSTNQNGPLFVRKMKFYISDNLTTNNNNLVNYNNSEKTLLLTLEVESIFNELRKEIKIRILDCNDPFFIYMYLIDLVEFEKIKTSQNLLISFESFPAKLINLFEKCYDNDNSLRASFILCLKNLSRSSLTLDIIELNEFKNFTHLSFVIPSASDDFIRNNFCNIYRKLRTENDSMLQTIHTLEEQLTSVTVSKSQELQNLQQNYTIECKQLETKQAELERKWNIEKDNTYENEKLLKLKISKLQLEMERQMEQSENQQKQLERECLELREQFSQELAIKASRVREAETMVKQLQTQLEHSRKAKEVVANCVKKNQLEMEMVKADLNKANEIIRKLQNEVKTNQGKLGILNEVTHKQEEIVGIKESTVERLTVDLKLCLQQLKLKRKEIVRLETDLDRLRSRLSQSELENQANRKVVANLNKELQRKLQHKQQTEEAEQRLQKRTTNYYQTIDSGHDFDEDQGDEVDEEQDDIVNLNGFRIEDNEDQEEEIRPTISENNTRRKKVITLNSNRKNVVDFMGLHNEFQRDSASAVPGSSKISGTRQNNPKNTVFSHIDSYRAEFKPGVNVKTTNTAGTGTGSQQPKKTVPNNNKNQRHVMAIPSGNVCSRLTRGFNGVS